jgi:hypothetical protein
MNSLNEREWAVRHLIFDWTDDWFFDTVEPGEKGMLDPKKIPSLFLALAIVGLVLTAQLQGQTYAVLHSSLKHY